MLTALTLLLAINNPAIDMHGFLQDAHHAAAVRELRRLTEEEFLAMSQRPGAVILDARSSEKFCELHVRGAVNLSFPDFTALALAQIIPDRTSPVLIYCNNNFDNAEGPFPTKLAKASLNLSTYVALYTYGYENVYELGPLIDIHASKLAFDSCKIAETGDPGLDEVRQQRLEVALLVQKRFDRVLSRYARDVFLGVLAEFTGKRTSCCWCHETSTYHRSHRSDYLLMKGWKCEPDSDSQSS